MQQALEVSGVSGSGRMVTTHEALSFSTRTLRWSTLMRHSCRQRSHSCVLTLRSSSAASESGYATIMSNSSSVLLGQPRTASTPPDVEERLAEEIVEARVHRPQHGLRVIMRCRVSDTTLTREPNWTHSRRRPTSMARPSRTAAPGQPGAASPPTPLRPLRAQSSRSRRTRRGAGW